MARYSIIPALFALVWPELAASRDQRGRVEYVGGTVTAIREGAHGVIKTAADDYLALVTKANTLQVDYGRVNLLEYGQNVSRRYVMAVVISPVFILAKKRRHFLTIGYQDDEGKQQALVFVVDKNDVRLLLASLEARTGVRVEFQDEEARRAGKG